MIIKNLYSFIIEVLGKRYMYVCVCVWMGGVGSEKGLNKCNQRGRLLKYLNRGSCIGFAICGWVQIW